MSRSIYDISLDEVNNEKLLKKLNPNTTEYVPKDKKTYNNNESNGNNLEPIKFNLNAKEYNPKKCSAYNEFTVQGIEDSDDEVDKIKIENIENEDTNKKFSISDNVEDNSAEREYNEIMQDIINNEFEQYDESEDEQVWYPEYKNCVCCKGFIYKCSGEACVNLDCCYCKAQRDFDTEA